MTIMESDLDRTMEVHAEDAVTLARKHLSIVLDYSASSVAELERWAELLYRNLRPEHSDARQMNAMSQVIGAYLGEVMRREVGGQWMIVNDQGTEKVALKMKDNTYRFPVAQALDRLVKGKSENIWHYFLFTRRDLDTL